MNGYVKPKPKKRFKRKMMKVGGSVTVPIPKEIRRKIDIAKGDEVYVFCQGVKIIIEKIERKEWDGRIERKD